MYVHLLYIRFKLDFCQNILCWKQFVQHLYGLESGSGPTQFETLNPDKNHPDPHVF
jgi:hypothetical protein